MEDSELFFIKRGRGRVLLLCGREYYKHTTYKSGNSIWRCSLYKRQHCIGTVTLNKVSYVFVYILNFSWASSKINQMSIVCHLSITTCALLYLFNEQYFVHPSIDRKRPLLEIIPPLQ
jgi:hypothetical protein